MRLQGALTAIITPFTPTGEIDEPSLRNLVSTQIDGRIDGLVVCGTTGESATLSAQEKLRIFSIVCEETAGRVPIVANTGGNNTRTSIQLTERVRDELPKVDAVMAVCPYYNKPNQAGLIAHFKAVAKVGLPTVVYNVPGRTIVSLTAESVGTLSHIDNIVAIKEASANLALDTEMMAAAGGRMAFLSGDDFTTFPFVSIGGDGCISVVSNIAPALVHDTVLAARRGDRVQGLLLHRKVNRIARMCFSSPNPAPTKFILAQMGVIASPTLRLPLVPPCEHTQTSLLSGMERDGLLPASPQGPSA